MGIRLARSGVSRKLTQPGLERIDTGRGRRIRTVRINGVGAGHRDGIV